MLGFTLPRTCADQRSGEHGATCRSNISQSTTKITIAFLVITNTTSLNTFIVQHEGSLRFKFAACGRMEGFGSADSPCLLQELYFSTLITKEISMGLNDGFQLRHQPRLGPHTLEGPCT